MLLPLLRLDAQINFHSVMDEGCHMVKGLHGLLVPRREGGVSQEPGNWPHGAWGLVVLQHAGSGSVLSCAVVQIVVLVY